MQREGLRKAYVWLLNASQSASTRSVGVSPGTDIQVRDIMQSPVKTVAADENVGLALQLMLWNDIRHLPVMRPADGKLVGVLSKRDILRVHNDERDPEAMGRAVRDVMSTPVEHIHPNAPVADAASDIITKRIGCLPVVDAGDLVGIVTVADLLSILAQYPTERRAAESKGAPTAATIMRVDPLTVFEDDPLMNAVSIMLRYGARHLCVVDADTRVLGMLSDRDVRSAIGDPALAVERELPEAVGRLRVAQVMTANPRTIGPDESLNVVLNTLLQERFGALPVVDANEHLQGIISYLDLLRHFSATA